MCAENHGELESIVSTERIYKRIPSSKRTRYRKIIGKKSAKGLQHEEGKKTHVR